MRQIKFALAFALGLLPLAALGQSAPANLPAQSVYGRMGIPGDTGPGQAIPFATLLATLPGAQSANTLWAGPTSGGVANPAFRLLVGADLPFPGASSLGGVQSKTCTTSNWFSSLSTGGVFGCTQPAFSDLTGSATGAQLPNPSASTLGGTRSFAAVSHQWINTISTAGIPAATQPACADVSDAGVGCNAARGQLPGETSTGSATAGNVGEYIESNIASGSATSVTTAVPKTITSISLTAGDWDVDGVIQFLPAATTSVTRLSTSLSLTTNATDITVGRANQQPYNATVNGGALWSNPIPPLRFSVSATTSVFLVADQTFTASTMTAYGIIRARRAR